jgi:hypothetical protein
MVEKDKKRDPMPPPNATPEDIGEFWDTHSLADYWDETNEVDFQVNLKLKHNLIPVEVSDQINTSVTKPDLPTSEEESIGNMSNETESNQLPTVEGEATAPLDIATHLLLDTTSGKERLRLSVNCALR